MHRTLWLRASVGIQFLLVVIPALDIVVVPMVRAAHAHQIAACHASDATHAGIQASTPASSHDPDRCILCQLCSPTAVAVGFGGDALPAVGMTRELPTRAVSRPGLFGWFSWLARGPPQAAA